MSINHPLPESALENHIAIVGITGSGKTITAKGIAEKLLDDGKRLCSVDPTGVWWGLKSTKDGKKGAYSIVIFGGDYADFPIDRTSGTAVAEIVADSAFSSVIDTSDLTVTDRTKFFTEFAETLLRKNRQPLHLFLDEAHNFAPQGAIPSPQVGMMLHATNNLASMGRSRGIRITMISQRPAKLNKDTLTQAQTLIAMNLIAPQDRKAIEGWVGEWAGKQQGAEIIRSLASMPVGEGWIWAPKSNVLEQHKFPMIKTYDSSKAPTGEGHNVILAKIDLAAIGERLKTATNEILSDDPKALKKRIAELEKKIAEPGLDDKLKNDYLNQGYSQGYQAAMAAVTDFIQKGLNNVLVISREPVVLKRFEQEFEQPLVRIHHIKKLETTPIPKIKTSQISKKAAPADTTLPPGEKKILSVLAQYPDGCTREQLTILTGYKRSSRDAYLQRLKFRGYAEGTGNQLRATPAGVETLGDDYKPLPTGQKLREYWLENLPEGEAKILAILLEHYPSPVARDLLSDATGYKRSSRDAYLQRLVSRQLVKKADSGVVAAKSLFSGKRGQ